MLNNANGEGLPIGDAQEREKALKALEKMKILEEEMAPRMSTIVSINGAIISGTNADWILECKKKVDRRIRTIM